jgi:hypothetical protein
MNLPSNAAVNSVPFAVCFCFPGSPGKWQDRWYLINGQLQLTPSQGINPWGVQECELQCKLFLILVFSSRQQKLTNGSL